MIQTWMAQNSANEIQIFPATALQPGHAASIRVLRASPPIHV